jgi:hypothetical protein
LAIPLDRDYEDLNLPTIEQILRACVSSYQAKLKYRTISAQNMLPTLQSDISVTSGRLFGNDPTGSPEH